MKRIVYVISLSLVCALLVTGCGAQRQIPASTPEETVEVAFSALKQLDIETFNACTNNHTNGSYQLFGEVLRAKPEDARYQLAQLMVENLSWEIGAVEQSEDSATVQVTVSNRDFSAAVGSYAADLLSHFSSKLEDGMSVSSLIRQGVDEARNSPENFMPYLEACEETISVPLTVSLKKTGDGWQIQLTDTLCDALTGNCGDLAEDVEEKLDAMEKLLTRNVERWNNAGKQNGQWLDGVKTRLEGILP